MAADDLGPILDLQVKIGKYLRGRNTTLWKQRRLYLGVTTQIVGNQAALFDNPHFSIVYVDRIYRPQHDILQPLIAQVEHDVLRREGEAETIPLRLTPDGFQHNQEENWQVLEVQLSADTDWTLQEANGVNASLLRITNPAADLLFAGLREAEIIQLFSTHFVNLHAHIYMKKMLEPTRCALQQREGYPKVAVWPSVHTFGQKRMMDAGTLVWRYPIVCVNDVSPVRLDGETTIEYVRVYNMVAQ